MTRPLQPHPTELLGGPRPSLLPEACTAYGGLPPPAKAAASPSTFQTRSHHSLFLFYATSTLPSPLAPRSNVVHIRRSRNVSQMNECLQIPCPKILKNLLFTTLHPHTAVCSSSHHNRASENMSHTLQTPFPCHSGSQPCCCPTVSGV